MVVTARDHLRPLLAALRTPSQRRALAAELRALAAEQERIADADERSGHVLRRARIETEAARQKTGRPRGSGAQFVRVEDQGGQRSPRLHIGRALWQLLGEPSRFDLQRVGGRVVLRPATGDVGYAVSRPPNGMPRISIGNEALDALGLLLDTRYAGAIEGGAIVLGAILDSR